VLLSEFVETLNKFMQINKFKDYCPKGLVVEGGETVNKVITGVSLCEELIDVAIEKGANAICVHHPHGFWDNQSKLITKVHKRKVKKLIENDISVLAWHLPLDAHPKVGNNVVLCQSLGMEVVDWFSPHNGVKLAVIGEYKSEICWGEFLEKINDVVGIPRDVFAYGATQIKRVGICSGSAPSEFEVLADQGLAQVYLTGEARENTQCAIQDASFNFIAAGHHQTEKFGPRALGLWIKSELGLEVEFVDIVNPV
jgi:dinuclear metal center YbgI/SA1388 family protein